MEKKAEVGGVFGEYLDLVDDNKDLETREEVLKLPGAHLAILNLSLAGNSTRSIAKAYNMSRSNVEKVLKKSEKLITTLKAKYGDLT